MSTARKNYVIPVSNGILEPRHREEIGSAIWLFLWLIDKSTKEQEDGNGGWLGLVLGGTPITARYVGEQIGESERSARRHLKQLEDAGYIIVLESTGEASGYAIRKSKKFHRVKPFIVEAENEKPEEKPEQPRPKMADVEAEPRPEVAAPPAKNGQNPGQICPRNKEEITGHIQGEDSKPLRTKKRRAVDPRRIAFIDALKRAWDFYNPGVKFEPSPAMFRNLDLFMRTKRSLELDEFKRWLFNRFTSEGVVPSEPIEKWIGGLEKYAHGPLDRYGKTPTKSGAQNGDHSKAQQRQNNSIDAIKAAADRLAGSAGSDSEGVFSGG